METMVKNEMNYRETMDDVDGAVVRIVKTREQRGIEMAMSINIRDMVKRKKRLRKEANIKKIHKEMEREMEAKLRNEMIERELIEEKLYMENARLLQEHDVKVDSERRSAISITTQNKVQPMSTACQVCLTMNAIYCCRLCKRMMCVRDTVYRNKIQFCRTCYYSPEHQPYIHAIIIDNTHMTCLKKLAKTLIWFMSFEWLIKPKKI